MIIINATKKVLGLSLWVETHDSFMTVRSHYHMWGDAWYVGQCIAYLSPGKPRDVLEVIERG